MYDLGFAICNLPNPVGSCPDSDHGRSVSIANRTSSIVNRKLGGEAVNEHKTHPNFRPTT